MEPPVATFGQVWGPKRWKASDGDPPSQEGERREALKPASAREQEHQASSTPAKPIGAVRRRVKRNPLRRCSWSVGRAWGLGQGNLDRGSLEGSAALSVILGGRGLQRNFFAGRLGVFSIPSDANHSAPHSRGRHPINLSGGGDPVANKAAPRFTNQTALSVVITRLASTGRAFQLQQAFEPATYLPPTEHLHSRYPVAT